MKPIRSLAFVVNSGKPGAVGLATELITVARESGVRFKQTSRFPLPAAFLRGCDACCVIGGDGTLLGVTEQAAVYKVPIIGINRGSLGFLTTFSPDEARAQFDDLLKGTFRVDARTMLSCSVGQGKPDLALNDVVIKSQLNTGLVHLEVFADHELVTDYLCDGLIFSNRNRIDCLQPLCGRPHHPPSRRRHCDDPDLPTHPHQPLDHLQGHGQIEGPQPDGGHPGARGD